MGPYDTTVGYQYQQQIKEITRQIETQQTQVNSDQWREVSEGVYETTAENSALGHWSHPIFFQDKVYIDARPFLNKEGRVRNITEMDYLRTRGKLEYLWRMHPASFEAVMRPATLVFSQWISTGIVSRYAGSPTDSARYRVLAAIYYIACFLQQMENRQPRIEEIKPLAIRVLGAQGAWVPPSMIDEVLGSSAVADWLDVAPSGLPAFVKALVETSETRLGNFTAVTLIQLMSSGSWVGHEAMPLASMALQYPPVFIQMLAVCGSSNMHKTKTRIGRAYAAMSRSAGLESITRFYADL